MEAIRTGAAPTLTAKDQALVYKLVTELIDTKRLSDASFAEAIAAFGEGGVVELGTIIGYYTAIGNSLNIFQVALPAGQAPYFAGVADRGRLARMQRPVRSLTPIASRRPPLPQAGEGGDDVSPACVKQAACGLSRRQPR